ncbi:MAG: M20/M25/M40 family metallo-hydrolase, partial [Psychrosphaera sp.]|nr:M20/M25/M40 family metallo-hydrolase [Psychrosphaera sp.]
MKITSGIFAVLLLSHICVANAVTLNRVETQMIKQVTVDEPEARALLKKVVNINSGSMNFEGVKQVGDIFALELQQLGFKTKWIDGKAFNRSGHLFAERLGKANTQNKAPKILMIGHLDTVFSKDSAVQKYIEVDDTYVKGPGIIDMKGGDVIIVYALKALKDAGILDQFSIQGVMIGDDEKRGRPLDIAAKVLIDSAKWADIVLGFE